VAASIVKILITAFLIEARSRQEKPPILIRWFFAHMNETLPVVCILQLVWIVLMRSTASEDRAFQIIKFLYS
jgi:hypothetical protein